MSLLAILHWAHGAGMLLHPLTSSMALHQIQTMLRLLGKHFQKFGCFSISLGLHPLPEPWLGGSRDCSMLSLWICSSAGENRDLLLSLKNNNNKKINKNISSVEKSVLFAEIGLGQFGS